MAQTYNYLREHGLLDYEELEARAAAATEQLHALSGCDQGGGNAHGGDCRAENPYRQLRQDLAMFTPHTARRATQKYLAEHEGDILLHKAAKKAFDELGEKFPTVKSLQEEYAKLLAEKRRRMPNTAFAR